MASPCDPADAGSVLKQLRERTTCPKCGGRYARPKLLPCSHCICYNCLELQQGFRKGLDFIVTCPACQAETELPKSGRDSLPDAFFKRRLGELCSRLERADSGAGCEDCDRAVSLTAFCRECRLLICSECRTTHGRLKSLADHSVIPLAQFSRELVSALSSDDPNLNRGLLFADQFDSPSPDSAPAELMQCPTHRQPLKLYCLSCHVLICHDCTVGAHTKPKHRYEFVDNLIQQQKADLESNLHTIRAVASDVRQAIADKTSVRKGIAEQQSALCTLIASLFQEVQEGLEQSKRRLFRVAQEKAEENVAKIATELDTLEAKSSEVDTLVQTCNEALQYTTSQEFMALRRNLQSRIKEMTIRRHSYCQVATGLPDLTLPTSPSEEIFATCRELVQGRLSASHAESKVEREKVGPAMVGNEVVCVVSVLTASGKPCIEKVVLNVMVSVARANSSVHFLMTPHFKLGAYQVSFVPTTKGEHLVSVYLGDRQIDSSPLKIAVQPSELELGPPCKVFREKEWPWAVACSSDREIFVTENYNHCISVWNKDGNFVKSIGQKGQKPGQILSPTGIAIDRMDNIYVADGRENGRIQKLSKSGQLLAIYVGLQEPYGVALYVSEDRVYVCNNGSRQISVLDSELKLVDTISEVSCMLDDEYEDDDDDSAGLGSPHSLAIDSSGSLYVTDTSRGCILVYSQNGCHTRSIKYSLDEAFAPSGIAIRGQHVYVADKGSNQVVVFTTAGEFVTATGSSGTMDGQFMNPSGLALDKDGYLYVCDFINNRVQVF